MGDTKMKKDYTAYTVYVKTRITWRRVLWWLFLVAIIVACWLLHG